MKVTVVGSYGSVLSTRNKEDDQSRAKVLAKFENACVQIGRALAEGSHRLIVAHDENPETAEALALRGFRATKSYNFHRCIHHEGDPQLKAHLDAVEESDRVVLIG